MLAAQGVKAVANLFQADNDIPETHETLDKPKSGYPKEGSRRAREVAGSSVWSQSQMPGLKVEK